MFQLFRNKKEIKSVPATDIKSYLKTCDLIDIREIHEFEAGRIPGAKNIPQSDLIANHEKYLSSEKEYLVVCQAGGRSSRACKALKDKGYNVINVSGGTSAYKGKLEKDKK